MAQSSISITVNGEAKEVEATTTGVELFSDDKNIIAVRLNGTRQPMSWPRPCRRSIPMPSLA